MRKPLTLRAQAVTWLAQREYSARELRLRLLRRLHAQQAAPAEESTGRPRRADLSVSGESQLPTDEPPRSNEDLVEDVIAWLLQRGYLDEDRFVASRVHVRAERFGVARIEQELSRHGLDLPSAARQSLRSTEIERARAVWQRRFGSPPADLRDAARQARFLVGRGFSGDVVRRVVPRIGSSEGCDPQAG